MSLVTRKAVFGICNHVRPKPAFPLQRLARVLKFRLQKVEVLYYPSSENKGWSAPLLFAYDKNRFSHDVAQIEIKIEVNISTGII